LFNSANWLKPVCQRLSSNRLLKTFCKALYVTIELRTVLRSVTGFDNLKELSFTSNVVAAVLSGLVSFMLVKLVGVVAKKAFENQLKS